MKSECRLCAKHLDEHDVGVVGALVVEGVWEEQTRFGILFGAFKGPHGVVPCYDHHMLCPGEPWELIPLLCVVVPVCCCACVLCA